MELYLLNEQLEKVANISAWSSLIWTSRYNQAGDFELYMPMSSIEHTIFKEDMFIIKDDDEKVMMIEAIRVEEDKENGDYLIVSGRSAEALLERRVNQSRLFVGEYESLYKAIYPLLSLNVLATAGELRAIPIIECVDAHNITLNSPVFISSERLGANVYESIKESCKATQTGFKLIVQNINNVRRLCFQLYEGVNRSKLQTINPRVTFSPDFGNLIKAIYSLDLKEERNCSFIAGEGEGTERKLETTGTASGLDRKELYIDARDLRSVTMNPEGQEIQMTDAEYREALRQRGNEKLSEHSVIETFDLEIEIQRLYKYKEDFFIGDIVTGISKYGIETNARIVEMNEVYDQNGYTSTPILEGV